MTSERYGMIETKRIGTFEDAIGDERFGELT